MRDPRSHHRKADAHRHERNRAPADELRALPMRPFIPTKSCPLGIAVVDRDHRRLIDLMHRVHQRGWAESPEAIRGAVEDLAFHVNQHFRQEEMLMRLCGVPDYESHRQKHVALAARVAEFQSLLRRGLLAADRFRDFLAGPMQRHILREDVAIKPFVDALETTTAA